jgi:hypothetical protein
MECAFCRGSGRSPFSTVHCPVCSGIGKLPDDPNLTETCAFCSASGRHPYALKICDVCKGVGKVPPVASSQDSTVFFIRAGTPRSAYIRLGDLFADLSGEACICDPYYGSGSLARLDLLHHCSPIRFLTQYPDKKETSTLSKLIQEWKTEHGNAEFRRYQEADLHDRFVLTDDELILLGHGLKDIGRKDSFIVRIHSEVAADLIETVRRNFKVKWQSATAIV